jgi:diguanylate cyclase (GGDEF)-like protein
VSAAPSGAADFTRRWAAELRRTGYAPLTRQQRLDLLDDLAGRMADDLAGGAAGPGCGAAVGRALVRAGWTAAGALGCTLTLLHGDLVPLVLARPGVDAAAVPARLARLIRELSAGYVDALRGFTVDGHEALLRSALAARERAEASLRESRARFEHALLHDALTGLPNRSALTNALVRAVLDTPPGGRLGLCLIDVDGFQAFNDSAGHPAGDQLLRALAARLSRLVGDSGHLLARVGADEFAVLVHGTAGVEDMTKLADRALDLVRDPLPGRDARVTASAGVLERAVAGSDAVDLLRSADLALHWAKSDGPDRYEVFDPARSRADVARFGLTAQLPAALAAGQFLLHYQPIVDLGTGRVEGLEALARWQHPVLGLLEPDRFVPAAEHTGLILPLGRRLLADACRQAVRWQGRGASPWASVNLSVRQLRDAGLVGFVEQELDRAGLPPRQLQLEITETEEFSGDPRARDMLRALRRLGVRLVLDDFGSGYANIAYLRDLPVDGVKLAAAFTNGGPGRADADEVADLTLLATLVDLAHALGLTVTAEGVETVRQARRLRDIGCDLGQGFYFGHPVPPALVCDG